MDADPGAASIMIQLAILFAFILVNAFFSGAEMAIVSVNKNRIHKLKEEGDKKAALIEKVAADSTRFLSTIQLAATFVSFAASAFAANSVSIELSEKLHSAGLPYSKGLANFLVTLILVYISLVFGELVPKRIALQYAEGFSFFCIKPVYLLSRVFAPFAGLLTVSTNLFLKIIGQHHEKLEQDVSEEEIKSMIETGTETGVFNDIEKEMITSIFLFDDKKVREVMVLRQEMVAVNLNEPLNEYIDEILLSRHSRIPVYEDNIDDIIGILSMKDFAIKAKECGSFYDVDVRSLLKPAYIASENMKTDALFRDMQEKSCKVAIIVDEYGGVSGMITMEDLVEEIVGEIYEDYEEVEVPIKKIDNSHYELLGSALLSEINEELHMHIESECDTLSGYLTEILDYIPSEEKCPISISDKEASYIITGVKDRVISMVKLELKPEEILESDEEKDNI